MITSDPMRTFGAETAQAPEILLTLAGGAVLIFLLYQGNVAVRKTDRIAAKTSRIIPALGLYAATIFITKRFGLTDIMQLAVALIVGLVAGKVLVKKKKRSRYVPARIKRAVIARDLGGEKYDSRKYEIDHIVPYSRGGDTSVRNLRVLPKSKNRSRGNKKPRLRDFI